MADEPTLTHDRRGSPLSPDLTPAEVAASGGFDANALNAAQAEVAEAEAAAASAAAEAAATAANEADEAAGSSPEPVSGPEVAEGQVTTQTASSRAKK